MDRWLQDVARGVWPDAWLATLMTGSLLFEVFCLLLAIGNLCFPFSSFTSEVSYFEWCSCFVVAAWFVLLVA